MLLVWVLCVLLNAELYLVLESKTVFLTTRSVTMVTTRLPPNNTTPPFIPITDTFSADIRASTAPFYTERSWSREDIYVLANVTSTQFHGLIDDYKGKYYTTDSVVTLPCSITRLTPEDAFYERLPDVYESGGPALVPCLLSGIPRLATAIQRCNSKTCDVPRNLSTSDRRIIVSKEGHAIILNSSSSDSAWYRCIGENECGVEYSDVSYLTVSSKVGNEIVRERKAGYVVSRRGRNSSLSSTIVENLRVEDKVVYKTLTELEHWKLYGAAAGYTDEVLYLDEGKIHLHYYSTHSKAYSQYSWYSKELNVSAYWAVSLQNSHVVFFDKASLDTISTSIKLSTEVVSPPTITPPADLSITASDNFSINFSIRGVNSDFNSTHNIRCYKNRLLLRADYRTLIQLTDQNITVTLSCPLSLDSGYYQCGIVYDIFYLSKPVFINVTPPPPRCAPETKDSVTARTASLSWGLPPAAPDHLTYFLFIHPTEADTLQLKPLPLNTSSTTLTHLTPHLTYSWYVTTPAGSLVTDRHFFTTLPHIPDTSVSNVTVTRHEEYLVMSWQSIPPTQWYADSVFFRVRLEQQINKTGGYSFIKTVYSNYSSVTLAALTPATKYLSRISVCNMVGCSANTSSLPAETKYRLLTSVPVLQVTSVSTRHVVISVSNTGYGEDVYLALSPESSAQCLTGNLTHGTQHLTKIAGLVVEVGDLKMATRYTLQVQSSNGYSHSPWSECLQFRTNFEWMLVVGPVLAIGLLLAVLVTLVIGIKKRYPEFCKDIKHACHKKHLYLYAQVFDKDTREDWEEENEIEIIHVQDGEV